jgi:formimidoylglutamate deiminase
MTTKGRDEAWLPDLVCAGGRLVRETAIVTGSDGRILRLSQAPDDLARSERLANRAAFPGFVNVHSHAFQRAIRGRTEHRTAASRDTFWTWREKMYRAAQSLTPEGVYATALMVFTEMALAGITTVGEFHYLHHRPDGSRYDDPLALDDSVVHAARDSGLRIVLLQCAYARAGWKQPPNPGQSRFLYRSAAEFCDDLDALRVRLAEHLPGSEVLVGVAPHSLRAVPLPDLHTIAHHAQRHALPVHIHVSEQRGENEQCKNEHGATPVTVLANEGLLWPDLTAIHCVHVSPKEVDMLAAAGASVCACPTTERNLGDGVLPAKRLFEAGVNLALGSDGQIQIAPLEDARELEYHLRLNLEQRAILAPPSGAACDADGLAAVLLRSATAAGARCLGARVGSLEPGLFADFFTVDLRDPSIAGAGTSLAAFVFGLERTAIRDVIVGGKAIVRDGLHPAAAEAAIKFGEVQRGLWRDS